MKRFLAYSAIALVGFFGIIIPANALSVYLTVQGGTGTSSPSGILYGDNSATNHLNTVLVGTGLTFTGGTLSATGGSGVTSVTGTYPVISSGGSTPAISLAFGTTTSNTWAGTQTFTNSPIFSTIGAGTVNSTSGGTIYNTATSSVSSGTGISFSGTAGALIGGSSLTITNASPLSGLTTVFPLSFANPALSWIGLATTSQPTAGQLLYSNGTNGLTPVSTTSATIGTGLSYSGTLGALVGGVGGTLTATLGTNVTPNELNNAMAANSIPYSDGAGTLFKSVATSTLAVNTSISSSGTLGYLVDGTASTLSLNLANPNTWTALQTFANASTTLLSASYASSTAAFFGTLNLPNITGTQCLHSVSGVVSGTGSDCGTGGGTGSIPPFATTTSTVSGENVIYPRSPDTSTGILAIGANSTTTAPFWYDPTANKGNFTGLVGIGNSNPTAALDVRETMAPDTQAITFVPTVSGSAGAVTAIGINPNITIGSTGNYRAIQFVPAFTANTSGASIIGLNNNVAVGGASNITNVTGNFARLQATAGGYTGTITTMMDYRAADNAVVTGQTTNLFGYVAEQYTGASSSAAVLLGGTALPNAGTGNYNIFSIGNYPNWFTATTTAPWSNQIVLASPRAAIVAGNDLGGVDFVSNDTNLTVPGTRVASIQAVATTTHTASALGTDITFSSTQGVAYAELMRLTGGGNLGLGTTSPYAQLSVTGNLVLGATVAGGTPGDLFLPKLGTAAGAFLAVDSTGKVIATTTPAGGGAVSSVSNVDGTLTISPTTGSVVASLALGHANSWAALQTFANATTTLLSASYASSTSAFFGTLNLPNLANGVLHVASGIVSSALVNLTSEVTGILPIANGGTGTSTVGVSGTVLTSNGSSAVWLSAPSTASSTVTVFTASSTWTKPGGAKWEKIIAVGGGGGGGGDNVTSSGGGGGGGGGYCERTLPASALGSTETVTIGSGGLGSNTTGVGGTNGGNTTFGSWCTANGGTLGSADGPAAGGPGGTATGGNINITGTTGGRGFGAAITTANGGSGGISNYGGASYGNGGNGATGSGSGSAGNAGLVIVYDFY